MCTELTWRHHITYITGGSNEGLLRPVRDMSGFGLALRRCHSSESIMHYLVSKSCWYCWALGSAESWFIGSSEQILSGACMQLISSGNR